MASSRSQRRRVAGVASTKIVITSLSLAATLGGWAAISALDTTSTQPASAAVAQAQTQPAPLGQEAPATGEPFGGRHRRDRGQYAPTLPGGDEQAPSFPGGNEQAPEGGSLPDNSQQVPQTQSQTQPQTQQTTPRVRTRSSR